MHLDSPLRKVLSIYKNEITLCMHCTGIARLLEVVLCFYSVSLIIIPINKWLLYNALIIIFEYIDFLINFSLHKQMVHEVKIQ